MSRPRNNGSRFKGLGAVSGNGNKDLAVRTVQRVFDGTIASARELTGISLEELIETMRWAKESEPKVARFFDAWDALGASEQQSKEAADAVCEQVELAPLELLRIVADVMCRIAMCRVHIIVALSHPGVVEKTIKLALSADKDRDKLAAQTILHKAMGFLPTPKGSQTIMGMTLQNAHAEASARSVAAPPPEEMIRRLENRWNASRGLPRTAAAALPERAVGRALPATIPEDGEGNGK